MHVETLRGFRNLTIVNWGRTDFNPGQARCLNRPEAVANGVNKLRSFQLFKDAEVPTPEWTTDPGEALRWANAGRTVYGRASLGGQAGAGIKIWGPKFNTPIRAEEFQGIRLFTRFWKADYEARYHVFNGEVIDIQRKRKINRESFAQLPERNQLRSYFIRSHHNGWVFSRRNIPLNNICAAASIAAVSSLGLAFGAVDVRVRGESAAVLEVNSAPGLEGASLDIYALALESYFNGR